MKQADKSIALIISVLMLSLVFSSSATAEIRLHLNGFHLGYGGHQNHYGINYRHNNYYPQRNAYKHRSRHPRHSNYKRRYSKHKSRHHNAFAYRRHSYYGYRRRLNNHYTDHHRSHSNQHKPCHQVTKINHDEYGVPHKIAGTLCYDRSGDGYIVPGSRYHVN